jgi:hypothetical protein
MRQIYGEDPGVLEQTICDGSNVWRKRVLHGVSFSVEESIDAATASACNPPTVLWWEDLIDSLRSGTLVGKDTTRGCTLVRAEYTPPAGLDV